MHGHPHVILPLVRLDFSLTALPFVSLFTLWRSFVSRFRGLFVRVPFDSNLDFILLGCLS